jgi:hypothetical protein
MFGRQTGMMQSWIDRFRTGGICLLLPFQCSCHVLEICPQNVPGSRNILYMAKLGTTSLLLIIVLYRLWLSGPLFEAFMYVSWLLCVSARANEKH